MTSQRDFFVSYSNADSKFADWINFTLREAGYSTLMQRTDMGPGKNYQLIIDGASKTCRRLLFVLSKHSLKSRFARQELAMFLVLDPDGSDGLVIPVRVDDVEPEGVLSAITYIDFYGVTDERIAKDRLLCGVEHRFPDQDAKPVFPGTDIDASAIEPLLPSTKAEVLRPSLEPILRAILDNPLRPFPVIRERHIGREVADSVLPRLFERQLEHGSIPACLVLDVDALAVINERMGIDTADKIIDQMLDILSMTPRRILSGRLGDDSLFLVLGDMTPELLLKACRSVLKRVKSYPWNLVATDVNPTCSVGAVLIDANGARDAVNAGVEACMKARANGGARFLIAPSQQPALASWRMAMS